MIDRLVPRYDVTSLPSLMADKLIVECADLGDERDCERVLMRAGFGPALIDDHLYDVLEIARGRQAPHDTLLRMAVDAIALGLFVIGVAIWSDVARAETFEEAHEIPGFATALVAPLVIAIILVAVIAAVSFAKEGRRHGR